MEVFDSHYFSMSKKLAICVGLWPYDTQKKYFIGSFWLAIGILAAVPQMIGIKVHFSDLHKLIEHFAIMVFIIGCFVKLFTLMLAEKELKNMYKAIMNNWLVIIDTDEKAILAECSERVLGYLLVVVPPLIPVVLNNLNPSSGKLPLIYIFNGEYLVDDRDEHYWKIYFCDVTLMTYILMIVMGVDPMYAVSIEHCIGICTIIKYRLQSLDGLVYEHSSKEKRDPYEYVIEIIKLHKRVLTFAQNLEASYSLCFLLIAVLNFVAISNACYLMISNLHDPVTCLRFAIAFNCLMVHYLVLSAPAQRLTDTSSQLFVDAYCSEWYASTPRTKQLLRLFMLRCEKPCILTAGGVMNMGMENYAKVIKTAMSYVTFLCSFK